MCRSVWVIYSLVCVCSISWHSNMQKIYTPVGIWLLSVNQLRESIAVGGKNKHRYDFHHLTKSQHVFLNYSLQIRKQKLCTLLSAGLMHGLCGGAFFCFTFQRAKNNWITNTKSHKLKLKIYDMKILDCRSTEPEIMWTKYVPLAYMLPYQPLGRFSVATYYNLYTTPTFHSLLPTFQCVSRQAILGTEINNNHHQHHQLSNGQWLDSHDTILTQMTWVFPLYNHTKALDAQNRLDNSIFFVSAQRTGVAGRELHALPPGAVYREPNVTLITVMTQSGKYSTHSPPVTITIPPKKQSESSSSYNITARSACTAT